MALPAAAANLGTISAGWRYRRGGDHFAYDYAMPVGTPLFAVQDGIILDCADGAANQPRGVKRQRSNWILLGFTWEGKKATAYYQHLSPGLRVKKGQRVKAGQLIAKSGNTGMTSGPHLHLATGWGHWTEATRYAYMGNDGNNNIVIFAPSKVYPKKPAAIRPITPLYSTTKVGKVGRQVSDLRWVLYKAGFLSKVSVNGSDSYDKAVQVAVTRFHKSATGARFSGGDIRQIGPKGWAHLQRLAGRK
jgi:murein DD-endopeptidase MepM/ murein hydrolase activator NlpD